MLAFSDGNRQPLFRTMLQLKTEAAPSRHEARSKPCVIPNGRTDMAVYDAVELIGTSNDRKRPPQPGRASLQISAPPLRRRNRRTRHSAGREGEVHRKPIASDADLPRDSGLLAFFTGGRARLRGARYALTLTDMLAVAGFILLRLSAPLSLSRYAVAALMAPDDSRYRRALGLSIILTIGKWSTD